VVVFLLLIVATVGGILLLVVLAARRADDGVPIVEVGEVLQDAFRVIRRNWLRFLPAALLIEGVPQALAWSISDADGEFFSSRWAAATAIETLVIGYFFQAMIARAAVQSLEGEHPLLAESAWLALKRLLPVLAAMLLSWLVFVAGYVLLIIPGLIAAAALSVVVPVMMAEGKGPVDALIRSRELTSGSRARILIILLGYLALTAISMVPTAILGGALGDSMWLPAVVEGIAAALTALFLAALLASLYVHLLRARGEGEAAALEDIFR